MSVEIERNQLIAQSFPDGFPKLWCPPLTHFKAAAQFDRKRIRAHLEHLSPYVHGLLVPGSTGVGVTVCGPKGRDKCQTVLRACFEEILSLGWPTSIYQLPQVTENELSGELIASLAAVFPNLLYFKDSSGTDQVALSGLDFAGLVLLRGA